MSGDVRLKVNSSVMRAKAQEIQNRVMTMEQRWNQIKNTITRSKGYWAGDASNKHQEYLKEIEGDIEKILKRIKEHPQDLLKMAGIYEKAETEVNSLAGALPDDIIQ